MIKKYTEFKPNEIIEKTRCKEGRKIKNIILIAILSNLALVPFTIESIIEKKGEKTIEKMETEKMNFEEINLYDEVVMWINLFEKFSLKGNVKDGEGTVELEEKDLNRFKDKINIESIRVEEGRVKVQVNR